MKSFQRGLHVLLALTLVITAIGFQSIYSVKAEPLADLIISEYIEGSSYNKAIEIYNGTPSTVNLNEYSIELYNNGNLTANLVYNFDTSLTLSSGETFQLVNKQAGAPLKEFISSPYLGALSDVTAFNGDDAIVLKHNGNVIDRIGQVGFDPGQAWTSGDVTTLDRTLVRKSSVCSGETNPAESFDPSKGWDVYPKDTFSYLGSHSTECSGGSQALSVAVTPANGATEVNPSDSIIGQFNQSVTVTETWYSLKDINNQEVPTAVEFTSPAAFKITPSNPLDYEATYTLTIFASQLSPSFAENQIFTFTTMANTCGDFFVKTYEIQGIEDISPYNGQSVTVEGVVTANLESNMKGFYIQDVVGDDKPQTSDGLFIYTNNSPKGFKVGDYLRIEGTVKEYYNLTELVPSSIQFCRTEPLPTPPEVALPFASSDEANLERYENMVVHFNGPLYINEYYQFDRYGEIVLASERLKTPTNVVEPGAAAIAYAAENALKTIKLDDGFSTSNPAYLPHPNGGRFCQGSLVGVAADCPEPNIFRGGDEITDLTAVVDYTHNEWKLIKTQPATYTALNQRTDAPSLVTGELRIATFNTLNYFPTLKSSSNLCGPNGGMECRGASTAEEFKRQQDKIIAAIMSMDADITGLLELENDNPTSTAALGADYAIKSIVDALNQKMGAGTWAYIPTGVIGTDAIKVGIIYKPAKVSLAGDAAFLTSEYNPLFIDSCNRPVMAQSFSDNATQEIFTLAVNHLKSKGSACAANGDEDTGDGSGASNKTRTDAAKVEVAWLKWLESDPTQSGSTKHLIMGDLNSYAKEDPIDAIKAGPDDIAGNEDDYIDLVERFVTLNQLPYPYGYVFGAQAGYIDGALANKELATYVLDAHEWHINADEADVLDYTMGYKPVEQDALYQPDAYRSSDHDPILISLMLNHAPVALNDEYQTFTDSTLSVDASNGVMWNDHEENIYESSVVTLVSGAGPAHGQVILNADGSFSYTPESQFTGVDTFKYTMSSSSMLRSVNEAQATVTIHVLPKTNPCPFNPIGDQTIHVGDPLSFTVVANSPDGSLTPVITVLNPPAGSQFEASNVFTWTPAEGQEGSYKVQFRACITIGAGTQCNDTTVNITVLSRKSWIYLPLISK